MSRDRIDDHEAPAIVTDVDGRDTRVVADAPSFAWLTRARGWCPSCTTLVRL
jgi:hypothetical protein